jgi:uncharacterized membrane protein YeaQ/YmgE (transglycosylase-associated protein family)
VVLVGLLAGLIADHVFRQTGSGLSAAASAPGLVGALLAVGSLVLAARRDPRAAPVAAVVGLLTALGFVAIHLAPHWSMFSDPYYDRSLDAVSWAEMLVTLASGLALSAVGVAAVRSQALTA